MDVIKEISSTLENAAENKKKCCPSLSCWFVTSPSIVPGIHIQEYERVAQHKTKKNGIKREFWESKLDESLLFSEMQAKESIIPHFVL